MNEFWSSTPTYILAPNGVVLVLVPGNPVPMTLEQFAAWSLSEAYKNASGRPFAHV